VPARLDNCSNEGLRLELQPLKQFGSEHMTDSSNEDDIFESIIEENQLEQWIRDNNHNSITVSDIYEGISILSTVQVDLHDYLKSIIRAIFINQKAGYEVEEIPQLTGKQIANLKQIFESAAIFLES
jgi:hypothetical protein